MDGCAPATITRDSVMHERLIPKQCRSGCGRTVALLCCLLVADLHIGTQAAVKLADSHGEGFDIGRHVQQGCVIAALLLNT